MLRTYHSANRQDSLDEMRCGVRLPEWMGVLAWKPSILTTHIDSIPRSQNPMQVPDAQTTGDSTPVDGRHGFQRLEREHCLLRFYFFHCPNRFTAPIVEVFPVPTVQRAFAQDALKCDTPYLFGLDDIRLEYLDIGLHDVSFECLDIGLADVEFAGIKPSHLIKS